MTNFRRDPTWIADIIRDAGGTIVGKTRLQKIAFLLELAGLGVGYKFSYHYYGPYSSALENDATIAWAFDFVKRQDKTANWGGRYSIFSVDEKPNENGSRQQLASLASELDAVELELAATAALLSTEGFDDPWEETKNRKAEKATPERLAGAKEAYRKLLQIETPKKLPAIV